VQNKNRQIPQKGNNRYDYRQQAIPRTYPAATNGNRNRQQRRDGHFERYGTPTEDTVPRETRQDGKCANRKQSGQSAAVP
jgi:hypothetical protein